MKLPGNANRIAAMTAIVGGSTFLLRIHRVTANVKTVKDNSHIMAMTKMEKKIMVLDLVTEKVTLINCDKFKSRGVLGTMGAIVNEGKKPEAARIMGRFLDVTFSLADGIVNAIISILPWKLSNGKKFTDPEEKVNVESWSSEAWFAWTTVDIPFTITWTDWANRPLLFKVPKGVTNKCNL